MNGRVKIRSVGPPVRAFRFADLLIIVIFLSGAVVCVDLFLKDLRQTFTSQNEEPVGIVVVKNNIVQRRPADRVLWGRLFVDSPVYSGDLIRVADLSEANLHIEGASINLNENTLIRIMRPVDGEGPLRIEVDGGSLIIDTGAESAGSSVGSFLLDFMGKEVQVGSGTVLNAGAGENGVILSVSEGTVTVTGTEGQRQEVSSGTVIALDDEGVQRTEPVVVVTQPRSNAHYLKSGRDLLPVVFEWNRHYIEADDVLRLEIAGERNFNRITHTFETVEKTVRAALDAGLWYWRLSYGNNVLSSGRFTITNNPEIELLSPAMNSVFYYSDTLPKLRFQWSEVEDVLYYILEVCETPDFTNPRINKHSEVAFFADSGLWPGTWYWRVQPVFSSVHGDPFHRIGDVSSEVSLFRIERNSMAEILVVEMPQPEPEPEPEPEQAAVAVPVPLPVLRLLSPAQGARLPGLTALREQTVFIWEFNGEVARSKFLLSRNPNPLQGRPQVEISNPGLFVRLDSLSAGVWYWTVEVETPQGIVVRAGEPRRLQVLDIPLLPAPGGRLPSNGHRIGLEELRNSRSVAFSWSPVRGANAYIFTLFQQTTGGRRQIIRTPPENRTGWNLDNISLLDRGTYVWQVEAVSRDQTGTIEQRGRVEENSFVLDVPLPGPVRVEEPGVLYGN